MQLNGLSKLGKLILLQVFQQLTQLSLFMHGTNFFHNVTLPSFYYVHSDVNLSFRPMPVSLVTSILTALP